MKEFWMFILIVFLCILAAILLVFAGSVVLYLTFWIISANITFVQCLKATAVLSIFSLPLLLIAINLS